MMQIERTLNPVRLTVHGYTDGGREQVTAEVWLEKVCRTCDGSGLVYSPVWAEWNGRMDNVNPNTEEAERLIAETPTGSEEDPCSDCDGCGYRPTSEGRAILQFIHRPRVGF